MSPRSRHVPLAMAGAKPSSSRIMIPRYQPSRGSDAVPFSSASLNAGVINPNFSLSSSTSTSRHRHEPSQWNATPGSFSKGDDYILPVLMGYNSMNISDTCHPMATVSGSDTMDAAYDHAAGEVLSRHAHLSTSVPQSGTQSQDVVMNDFFNDMGYNQYSNYVDGDSLLRMANYANRAFTPPPEAYLEAALPQFGVNLSHDLYDDHCSMIPDTSDFPALTKCLHYSGSRHHAGQQRPMKSATEQMETQCSSPSDPESRSPPEDHPDRVKARTDPLYDARPDKDGLYYCPMVKEFKCEHKPTKQRCIYAKYLDSHLRPYRCKFAETDPNCEDIRFSSNACLFRHEREAHGMHNHGVNPYLCDFQECERSRPGNGFPRRWNQRDHMRRVHAWIEDDSSPPIMERYIPSESKRRRGPRGPSLMTMRRPGPSYSKGQVAIAAYSRDALHAVKPSRHQPQVAYPQSVQPCNLMAYNVSLDDVQFAQTSYPQEYRHSQPCGYYQAVY